ncbi:MAG: hypothetical protein ABIO91_02845 [Pyrinomonadaceae bacterium]
MSRKLRRCAVIAVIALSTLTAARAQTSYSIPHAVNLNPVVRRAFPIYYRRLHPGIPQQLYTDGFYPIGWSRDGKFAYYSEPVDEECGCYFAELAIVDLRTDKVVWQFTNKPQDRVDAKGETIPDDMRKLWKRNEKLFSEKLREHNIIQTPRFVLMPATFRSAGKSYTAKVSATKGDDPDGMNRVGKLRLDLTSPTLGKKTLFSADYKGDEMYVSPLDAAVAGAFMSPFENRAAVVMIKVQRGWEGPPHNVDAQIAGADLVNGFRK